MPLLHRRANRRAERERWAALHAEAAATAAVEHYAGEIVDVTRDDGSIDTVRIMSVWTAAASCIPMLTVAHHPRGLQTFVVRADAVVVDDAPGGGR